MDELQQQNPIQPLVDVPLATAPTPEPQPQTKPVEAQAPSTPEPQAVQTAQPVPAVEQKTAEKPSSTPVTVSATTPSEEPGNGILQLLMENKKLVIIGIIVVIAVIIGLSVLIGAKSSSEYQGLIKRIDTETQELTQPSPSIASPSNEIIPVTNEEPATVKVSR